MLTKDLAICIRATDFSETSQIVTFFARENGKISAIAKGSKRPKSKFDGPIEVFAHGKIVFSDSSDKSDSNKEKLATLTEFQQQPGFANLNSELFVLHCCLFAMELLNSMTGDYDPHPGLFDSFLQFLENLDAIRNTQACPEHSRRDAIRDATSLLILFQLTLLREVGLIPVFDSCVNCKTQYAERNTQYEAYFSSSANGLICRDCEASFLDKIKLTKNAADCLVNLKLIADADEKTLNEIEKLLIHHFTEILHHQPKMAKHVVRGS